MHQPILQPHPDPLLRIPQLHNSFRQPMIPRDIAPAEPVEPESRGQDSAARFEERAVGAGGAAQFTITVVAAGMPLAARFVFVVV